MSLADYIDANKDRIIERWKARATERLSLELDEFELVDELPEFIDDVTHGLRDPSRQWPAVESARSHGIHRLRIGVDIGALTEEMALLTEVICELADEDERALTAGDMRRLSHVMGQGTAASVRAYASMRDDQLCKQAQEHFSFIAHEIRTPLHAARLAATLLAEGKPADRETYLARLDRSLSRLADLIDNSLLEVRLSGEPDISVSHLDARALVEAACEEVEDHAESRGLSLAREVEDLQLEGDRKLLVSALANLLKNAVKFTRPGGRIIARACATRGGMRFEVEDQCGGMPEDLPGRLFQPFVQANRDKTGFGLGLSIVKRAAEAHGGSVRVFNHPGHGCSFVMDIPIANGTHPG